LTAAPHAASRTGATKCIFRLIIKAWKVPKEQPKTKEKAICQSAQETLNIIIDYNRETYNSIQQEEFETDKNLIDKVSSINLKTFLTRKNNFFILCMMKPLTKNGITTLSELIQAHEYETDERLTKTMRIIVSTFPESLVNILKCHNEEINSDTEDMKYMLTAPNTRKNIHCQRTTSNFEDCTEENWGPWCQKQVGYSEFWWRKHYKVQKQLQKPKTHKEKNKKKKNSYWVYYFSWILQLKYWAHKQQQMKNWCSIL
jgi:hypothetical protein